MKKISSFVLGTAMAISLFSTNSNEVHASTAASFKDMKGHWAELAVKQAAEKGYIKGYEDNTFRPKAQVTRAEFAAMLTRTIPKEVTGVKVNFTDVSDSFWGKDAIEKGLALGFINPSDYANSKFQPNQAMTRAELAKWMANGLNTMNSEYGKVVQTLANSQSTLIPIPEFYGGGVNKKDLPYIGLAMGTGLLNGYEDDTFRPNGTTTRAEVAAILMRLVGVMEKQPTSFKGINELVEVAETGTNLLANSEYQYRTTSKGNLTNMKDILSQPITYKYKMGVAKVKRYIVLDPVERIKGASIFENMFIGNDNRFPSETTYRTFLELEFTPNKDIPKFIELANGTNNAMLSMNRLSSESKIKQYNLEAVPREEFHTYFKKHKTKTYWNEYGLDKFSKDGHSSYSISTDNGNQVYITRYNR